MIQIPLEIGDLILGGRFKNKKITVKEIGYDEYGSPTVNGRPILKVRIPKLYQTQENNMNESSAKNDPKIEKLVNQINQMIELAVDSDDEPIAVVDKSGTWEEPYIYFPIQYKNGALKITSRSQYKKTPEVEVINKRNMEYDGIPTLRNIAKMYKKTIPMRGKSVQEMTEAKIPSGKLITLDSKVNWGTEKELPFSQGEAIKRVISQYNIPAIKWGYYKTGSIIGVETKKQKMFWSDKGSTLQFLGILNKGTNEMKKLKETVKPFQSNPIEVKIKKDSMGRWNATLQTVNGEADELFAVGYETKEQAEHAAMMYGYSFAGNPYSPKTESSLKSLVRNIVERELRIQRRRSLHEVAEIDDAEIEEYARLADQIDKYEAEIAKLKKRFGELDDKFRKMLETLSDELGDNKETFIRYKKILIKIKKRGYERTNYKYKEAFDWLYERVSPQMKKLITETLEAHKSITTIKSSLSVQYEAGNWFKNMFTKFKNWFSTFITKMRITRSKADSAMDKLETMI